MNFLSKRTNRFAALVIAFLMVISMLPSGMQVTKAETLPVTGDFSAAYATTAINIDGVADEEGWQVSQELTDGITSNTSNTARFGSMWDENYLYIAVDVTDTSKETTGGELWEVDSVEIYIDGDFSRTYNNHSIQYIIKRDDPVVYAFNDALEPAKVQTYTKGILHTTVDTASGYTMEIGIPWSTIGGMAPPAGNAIGITAHVNDRDVDLAGTATIDTIGYTASLGDGDWCDATNWAKMTLVENGDPTYMATPVTYEFTRLGGLDGVTNPQAGWFLLADSCSNGHYLESYGYHTENYDLDNRYADFNFTVPSEGDYALKLKGFLAGGGAICDIKIDGQAIGQYDFFGGGAYGELKLLSDKHLTAGSHILTITPAGSSEGSWGYNIYASQFVLDIPVTSTITYEFSKLGGLEGVADPQAGWSLLADTSSDGHYLEVYGYHTENYDDPTTTSDEYYLDAEGNPIDRYSTFNFETVADGDYEFKLKGFLAGGGAICDITVDDAVYGQYDFFGAGEYGVMKSLPGMYLTKGNHILKITPVGQSEGSWGFNIYASQFVVEQQPKLASLKLGLDYTFLVEGQNQQVRLEGTMTDGTIASFDNAVKNFTSSNSAVASVNSQTGVITAVSAGAALINAQITLNGVTINKGIKITVITPEEVDIRLTANETFLLVSDSTQMKLAGSYNGFPVNMPQNSINVSISDSSIISIDSNNMITALKVGNATIQADVTFGTVTRQLSLDISVEELALDTLTLTVVSPTVYTGQTTNLVLEGVMNNGDKADLSSASIVYSSQTPEVATVDQASGLVTAVSPGIVTIDAVVTLNNTTRNCSTEITVIDIATLKGVKTKISLYTAEKIATARENIAMYNWAGAEKDNAVAVADGFVALGDEFLWNMVTSQLLPRSYTVNEAKGSPVSGRDIYTKTGTNYSWIIDTVNHPWKIQDPISKDYFPTNDFEAYYMGGLDVHGNFDPVKAKQHNDELIASGGTGNLVNLSELHTDNPGWGVDDGYGFIDTDGTRYTFIAYYNHWGLWYSGSVSNYGFIQRALDSLRDAYIYTGDGKYAHSGTILLDRIADVYPSMDSSVYKKADGFLNSHGGTGLGKVIGSIWETVLVPSFIRAYDAFFPGMEDTSITSFLSVKASQYGLGNPKLTADAIKMNIENGILRQVVPGVKNCQLEGNTGMQQSCVALAAVVIDTLPETKEWLDFDFKDSVLTENPRGVTGGDLWPILVDDVDRDGQGNEAAPGYNGLWLDQLKQVADVIDGYSLEGLDFNADLYENPKFMKMFTAFYPLILSGRYTAQIGDTGAVGNPSIIASGDNCIQGFIKTNDPLLAQMAYYLKHNSTNGIHANIFTHDPEKVAADIQSVIDTKGELKINSSNMTGFGFAALRDGTNYFKSPGIIYQFSNMDIVEQSANLNYYSESGTEQFEAFTDGNHITFGFDVVNSDDYEVDLRTFKATSYGIYDIYVDDQLLNTYDFYGGSGAGQQFDPIGNITLAAGTHTIKFVGHGKNPLNTDDSYKMGLIELAILDNEARAIRDNQDQRGDTQRDDWIYYGSNGGHGHADALNLGMHAFGLDIAPELGYPEVTGADPMRMEWVSNTISHNTVVVDKTKQGSQTVGQPMHFDDSTGVKLIDVDAKGVYNQTQMYRRTTAMIKVDDENSYTLDLFRVMGGNDHYYSFHSTDGTVSTEGLELIAQSTGTYAGPDVEFGVRSDSESGWGYTGSGFHYLKDVEKQSNPQKGFSIDWKINDFRDILPVKDDIHLKLTMLNDVNDVALANGVPPQRSNNPETLKYMIAHRNGSNLNSLFAAIYQPYKVSPFIDSMTTVPVTLDGSEVTDGSAVAVKVVLKNGRTDYIVNALDVTKTYIADSRIQFKGFFGVYSEMDGQQVYGYVNDGTVIGSVHMDTGSVSGTVADFTKELSNSNEIQVQLTSSNIDLNNLAGRYIYIENDGIHNASYRINSASAIDDTHIALNVGDTTLIRSYADPSDFAKGYIYDVAIGSEFTIQLSSEQTAKTIEVTLISDKTELTRTKTAALTVSGKLNTGDDVDLSKAEIEYFSSNPDVAKVENGIVTAYNAGSADIHVKVTVDGMTVESNMITIKVSVGIDSLNSLIGMYQKSGDIKMLTAIVLKAKLKEVSHQIDKGSTANAIKQMKAFVELINIGAKLSQISAKAKVILIADANTLINILLSGEQTVKLSKVELSAKKTELARAQTARLTVKGELNTGHKADLLKAKFEYFSSNPDVVKVENGIVTAYNAGSSNIYVKVTVNDVMVQSNTITIKVKVSVNSLKDTIDRYQKSGDIKRSLASELKVNLDQVSYYLKKGSKNNAVKKMQDLLELLDKAAKQGKISAEAKDIISADTGVFINNIQK